MLLVVGGLVGYIFLDGGWGWVVVIGVFIFIGFFYVFFKLIIVFFKEIEGIFYVIISEVLWIFFIMLVVMYGGGFISSILVNKYGSCIVMIVGGCLLGCGLIVVFFCNIV